MRELLDIYLITSFIVGNFRNTEAMRVIFFWKYSKFNADSKNEEKIEKKCFVFQRNASELFPFNSIYQEETTCHQQSMYE